MTHRWLDPGRWRWLGVEFTVILLGVLAALFVDTWLEDRENAERAEVYRLRLIADLERDLVNLELVSSYYIAIRNHGLRVLSDLDGQIALDDFSLLFSAFNAAEEWGFVLGGATYNDMQATGGLSLIEDVSIRLALSEYYLISESREVVWNLPRAFRENVRGIIPDALQSDIHAHCSSDNQLVSESGAVAAGRVVSAAIEPLTGTASVTDTCGLDETNYDLTRAVAELRGDSEIARQLRFRMSEARVAVALFKGQRALAEDLVRQLRDSTK